jgi:hypothetical protein
MAVVRDQRPDSAETHRVIVAAIIPGQDQATETGECWMLQQIPDAVIHAQVRSQAFLHSYLRGRRRHLHAGGRHKYRERPVTQCPATPHRLMSLSMDAVAFCALPHDRSVLLARWAEQNLVDDHVLGLAYRWVCSTYTWCELTPRKEMVDRGRIQLPTPGFSAPGTRLSWRRLADLGPQLGTALESNPMRVMEQAVADRICREHGAVTAAWPGSRV